MGKGRGKVDSVLNAGVEDSCETFNMEGGELLGKAIQKFIHR